MRRTLLTGLAAMLLAAGCSNDDAPLPTMGTPTSRPAPTTLAETTTSTVPVADEGEGTLASATIAIRAACRRHYDSTGGPEDRPLTKIELAAQCDEPGIEWRSDCYADRPAEFVPGVGGCAHLGGYLAVWYGRQPLAEQYGGGWYFEVGAETWTIGPESD